MRVVLISGSPNVRSRSGILLDIAASYLQAKGVQNRFFHLTDFFADDLIGANFAANDVKALIQAVKNADALVIGTPVYKASFSGGLKTMLDLLPERALLDKAVLTCVTGGTARHMLAVDYALKPVLSALKAQEILDGIFAVDEQVHYGEEPGRGTVDAAVGERLEQAVELLYQAILRRSPVRPGSLENSFREARFSI